MVTEVGATLRSFAVGGRPVVEPFAVHEPSPASHGQVLAPWPNRVADGRWDWDGERLQLALTAPAEGNALHGLVCYLPWQVREHAADRVVLETLLAAQPGWPFVLRCVASYAVGPGGLTATLAATNVGRRPCPYGAGVHPYLAAPGGVDAARLGVPAAGWLRTDERGIPVDRQPVDGTPYDLRDAPPLAGRVLDTAFTGLERDPDGRVTVRLAAGDGGRTTLWGDASARWLQVFTGDTLPGPWRRRAVAVEPMTCPPDALRSGEDLVVLAPGDEHTLMWGLRFDG